MDNKFEKKMCAIRELASQFENIDADVIESYILVHHSFEQLRMQTENWLAKFDLNRARFIPLAMLFTSENRRLKPSELAENAGVSRATMTGILDGLEKAGYTRRASDSDDRRAINVELTTQGEKLMRKVLPFHFNNIVKMMDGVTEAERKALASVMRKIDRNLEENKKAK